MSDKSENQKRPHERVSLGEKALESRRRSGVSLAHTGHLSALSDANPIEHGTPLKTGRAIRAKIKPIHQSERKD
jgi:hypothetical protein